eukprot:gnl/TRDRNA2_/TRDRNA2_90528_c0_seq1.p1 gnl/TRDRNA2_/TRDRNA2_90528_c0~~gnl/TRDRNA2_/TRDRNA2_90528_c0_seq1.p1  ORF type:complete len:399 (-),score=32.18 gnl/TRDRNA2_/TRDRNA2_90528_c0_seq1:80-1276(-)
MMPGLGAQRQVSKSGPRTYVMNQAVCFQRSPQSVSPVDCAALNHHDILDFFKSLPTDNFDRVRKSHLKEIMKAHAEVLVEKLFGTGDEDRLIGLPEFCNKWQSGTVGNQSTILAGPPFQCGEPVVTSYAMPMSNLSTSNIGPPLQRQFPTVQRMMSMPVLSSRSNSPGYLRMPTPVHSRHGSKASHVRTGMTTSPMRSRSPSPTPQVVTAAPQVSPIAATRILTPRAEYRNNRHDLGNEYTVILDRSAGGALGIDVDPTSGKMQVKSVIPGLVHKWNQANPDKAVKIDDSIVEVNGCRGDVFMQHDELKKAQMLHVVLQRSQNMTAAVSPPVVRAAPLSIQAAPQLTHSLNRNLAMPPPPCASSSVRGRSYISGQGPLPLGDVRLSVGSTSAACEWNV